MEAAKLTVYNAARLRDAGRPFLQEAAICKILSSEVAERVSSLAVNLFGGNGFVKEYPVEKLFRDAKIGQIYEGHVKPAAADDCKAASCLDGRPFRCSSLPWPGWQPTTPIRETLGLRLRLRRLPFPAAAHSRGSPRELPRPLGRHAG